MYDPRYYCAGCGKPLGEKSDDMIDRLTLDKDNYFVFGTDRSEVKSRILEAESLNTISIIARNILPKSFIDLGHGCVIQRLCYVSTTAKIGSYVKINVGAQVHHEALVGDLSTIAPMSCLLGKVMVGQKSFIGAGSLILPGIKIGNNCLVAAGSVVTRDVPDNYRVKGNPAKTF